MNKRALLIGNNGGGLEGVKIDLYSYKQFLKGQIGGSWFDSEIKLCLNPSRSSVLDLISTYRNMKLDYFIFMFSGHAGQLRDTVLELNPDEELLSESRFNDLGTRQLNIFDCCRSFPEPLAEKSLNESIRKAFSATGSTREQYERRIMQAIPQSVSLYSCSIGETSSDTSSGGIYFQNLLSCATSFTSTYKLVGTTHEEAKQLTERRAPKQHPDAVLPKCLSFQQLIFSINPNDSLIK